MPSVNTRSSTASGTGPATSVWKKLRAHLESERDRLRGEIGHYPTPIPRCDAQFNHLVEQRERVSRELDRMAGWGMDAAAPEACVRRIEDFIRSSGCLDAEAKQKFISLLNAALAGRRR